MDLFHIILLSVAASYPSALSWQCVTHSTVLLLHYQCRCPARYPAGSIRNGDRIDCSVISPNFLYFQRHVSCSADGRAIPEPLIGSCRNCCCLNMEHDRLPRGCHDCSRLRQNHRRHRRHPTAKNVRGIAVIGNDACIFFFSQLPGIWSSFTHINRAAAADIYTVVFPIMDMRCVAAHRTPSFRADARKGTIEQHCFAVRVIPAAVGRCSGKSLFLRPRSFEICFGERRSHGWRTCFESTCRDQNTT